VNTLLSTTVDEQNYNHPPSSPERRSTARRVSLADRVALHLGLALVTWSRRARTVAPVRTRDDHRRHRSIAAARAAREHEWQLSLYLSQLRR
jgi:hypothetical protein